MVKYKVILEPAEEGGYVVSCPAIPGTYSQGESAEEAISNIKEAIELSLECYRDDGVPFPDDVEVIIDEVEVAV
jgi:antitoxin HicB